jgi:hypothetical protein
MNTPSSLVVRRSIVSFVRFVSFVEVAGIEPASSGLSIGLLRAQPVVDCRDRYLHWQLWRSVSGLVVPNGPSARPVR